MRFSASSPSPAVYETRDADRHLSHVKTKFQTTGVFHKSAPFSTSAPRAVLMQMRTYPQPR